MQINYLGVPRNDFGSAGVDTVNMLHDKFKSGGANYDLKYDKISKNVVVLNSSKTPPEIFNKMLYSEPCQYVGCFPEVEKKRDSEGNVLIKLTCVDPRKTSLLNHNFGVKECSRILKKESASLEIYEAQKTLSEFGFKALNKIAANAKQELQGVWYPNDLKTYLQSTQKEMPADYWTGFANPEYFEKNDRFTFCLKKGKSAAGAIEALLEGPSVLDCGNATQVAYYKSILDFVGREKFDCIFSGGDFNLKITQHGITDKAAPISHFADYTEASKKGLQGKMGNRPVKVGEECHFKGVEWYGSKHGDGFAGGWNVICIGKNDKQEQLFIGHGLNKPMTEKEINRLLVEQYNLERTSDEQEFISKLGQPKVYDKNLNHYLKNFYQIPVENSDAAVDGFLKGSCRALDAEKVIIAKKCSSQEELKIKLSCAKTEDFMKPARFFDFLCPSSEEEIDFLPIRHGALTHNERAFSTFSLSERPQINKSDRLLGSEIDFLSSTTYSRDSMLFGSETIEELDFHLGRLSKPAKPRLPSPGVDIISKEDLQRTFSFLSSLQASNRSEGTNTSDVLDID